MALTAAGASSPGSSARLAASCLHGVRRAAAPAICGTASRQREQPGGFDADALADQAAFRQDGAQRIGTLAITAVDGRERERVLRDP